METLDQLTEIDNQRYTLLKDIKHELYTYIGTTDLKGVVGVDVKQNTIILKSQTELSNDFIDMFTEDYNLALCLKKNINIENYCNNEYPMGFTSYMKYIFKSSGGII